ncbi:MAG: SDR family oxidoreductase [Tissierellales bacterium]|nr:SDR family oxidoreductase [Tissierellales bacterium]
MELSGETALITGSTSGIGKKLAEILLKMGCRVAICSRSQNRVKETINEFKKIYGDSVTGTVCDVSRFGDLQKIVEQIIKEFGSLRILIANAGILPVYGPFRYLTEEQIVSASRAVLDVNLIGTINSVGAVLPQMQKQKYGRIITLTGGGDNGKVTNLSLYGASKGGVCSFSKCIAEELKTGDEDIKLNIFQPGPMNTNLNRDMPLVSGWKDETAFRKNWQELYSTVNLDIEKCCQRVIPFITPECKKNGKTFLGFSVVKMIPIFMRIQKIMKDIR